MHVRGVDPREPRPAGVVLATDEVFSSSDEFVVARFHALLRQWSGVLDALLADPTPTRLLRRIVLLGGPAVQHAARTEALAEVRKVLGRRVIGQLRLLLGIEVIQVAKELVEAMDRWQELIAVPEVVLTKLAGGIAER